MMPVVLLSLTVADADAEDSFVHVHVNVAGTISINDIIDDYLHPFWTAAYALLTGTIWKAEFSLRPDISAWGLNPPAIIADVQERAIFTFKTGSKTQSFVSIPTINESYFRNAGADKVLDVTNATVAAFITLLTTPQTSGGINACDSRGTLFQSLINSRQQFSERG